MGAPGLAVPLVFPVPKAWRDFDAEGHARDEQAEGQGPDLEAEVARAARVVRAAREPAATPLPGEVARPESAAEGRASR